MRRSCFPESGGNPTMNIERALSIDGWMSPLELAYLASVASHSSFIAEIGSWMGRSTCAIAANTTGEVFSVDTWAGSYEQGDALNGKDDLWLLRQFQTNTKGLHITPVRKTSLDAARFFFNFGYTFDMIFIDAMHEYDSVYADIKAWMPLLKPGGVLCGHDFHPNWPGVIQAVNELIPSFRVVDTIWTTDI